MMVNDGNWLTMLMDDLFLGIIMVYVVVTTAAYRDQLGPVRTCYTVGDG